MDSFSPCGNPLMCGPSGGLFQALKKPSQALWVVTALHGSLQPLREPSMVFGGVVKSMYFYFHVSFFLLS